MPKYDPKKIEKNWQKFWKKNKTFEVKEDAKKKKFYSLIEFPYPSAEGLHVGHPRPFTAMDVVSRKKRMEGFNVLYPIGFDAFGLPTENFAIKTKQQPSDVTKKNIANFTRQLKSLGYSFDWSRAVDTTDPKYFKWTQWIFLQLYKHGLAYKKNQPINWCPKDKIGLANEEVVQGCCERCGTPVEQRNKEQWMLRITKYADKLLEGLKAVDYITPARVQQENWIGKSEGAEIRFELIVPTVILSKAKDLSVGRSDSSATPQNDSKSHFVTVFTTRPDTIFGATFLAVSPELANKWLSVGWMANDNVKKYIAATLEERKATVDREEKEKTGVDAGIKAVNPVTGEEIPVWITNYILGNVGTGAIMAVPAHDERDFEFAKKFGLQIKEVVAKKVGERLPEAVRRDAVFGVIRFGDKIFIAKEKENGLYRLPGGGYEEGESDEQALKREVTEETGFTEFSIDEPLGTIEANYYYQTKNINRHRFSKGYVVRLVSEEKIKQSAEDKDFWEHEWVDIDEAIRKFETNKSNLGEVEFLKRVKNPTDICFTEEGTSISSDFLSGLTTKEAKEKMIIWLEEKGIGKRQVNYKLRDWVFSRQRYWGEPIPLVFCESCKNKKQKVLLIHGFTGRADKNWLPWMNRELEKQGFEVFAPTMTTTDHPVFEKWMEELEPFVEQLGEDDVIIGHSLGGKAALHILERSKKKIGHLYLVAPVILPITDAELQAKEEKRPERDYQSVKSFWNAPLDWKKIQTHVSNATAIFSDDDPSVPFVGHEVLPADWRIQKFSGHQHFTATEIPALLENILQSKNTGWVPLPESELPLELPKVKNYEPTDNGESPLAAMEKWVKTKCPRCGGPARRETDTMPNWAGSSWYFLRYCDPSNDKEFASVEKLEYWMGGASSPPYQGGVGVVADVKSEHSPQLAVGQTTPGLEADPSLVRRGGGVDWYNGGMEHTVLHLLYSRFWNQFLYDIGVVPTREPYKKRTSHGMILGPDGEKMSKSRGNVINPDEMVEKFGADAFRMYIMFMGPFDQAVMWDTNGLVGVRRFLDKVWNLQERLSGETAPHAPSFAKDGGSRSLASAEERAQGEVSLAPVILHQTIKKVTEDIDKMSFNTAVAKMMELANHFTKEQKITNAEYGIFAKLLSPFAPHLAEEIWTEVLGHKKSLAYEQWPMYDEAQTHETTLTIALQINGKVRDTINVAADATEESVQQAALASEKVQKWLEGKTPKKIIYVKGKLVSIVI